LHRTIDIISVDERVLYVLVDDDFVFWPFWLQSVAQDELAVGSLPVLDTPGLDSIAEKGVVRTRLAPGV
jgi:hypothetical protein